MKTKELIRLLNLHGFYQRRSNKHTVLYGTVRGTPTMITVPHAAVIHRLTAKGILKTAGVTHASVQ